MSYPPPPGQSPYPAGPSAGGKQKLRGRIPLRLSLIFGVIGVVLVVVGAIVLANTISTDDFDRVSISSGSGTASFDETGNYVAYFESPGLNIKTDPVPNLQVTLTSPSGDTKRLTTFYGGNSGSTITTLTYNSGGHDGAALYQFTITEKGSYKVDIQSSGQLSSQADLAFGKSIAGGLAAGVLLVLPGVLLIIVAIVLLIVGIFRRRGHKKQLAAGYGGGYGPPPGNYPPPGQGYPAPR